MTDDPIGRMRGRIARKISGVFHDAGGSERPLPPSDNAYFAKDTPIRMVHADVVAMMVGGVSALLLQMLHPHALRGVLDHSNFRRDMHGRLRRTAQFIAVTTYGARDRAEDAIARVNAIHEHVQGELPDGTAYSATDPATLAWVHLAEAMSFLAAHRRYVAPAMTGEDQDRYYAQFAVIARKLHADPVPESRREAELLMRRYRPLLAVTAETRDVARTILKARTPGISAPAQKIVASAAVDLLPAFARQMLGLKRPGLATLPLRTATFGLASGVRWVFSR